MAIVISGVNNDDKITAIDGTIDLLSSANLTGILTAPAISSSGNITASGNVSGVNITSSNNLTAANINVGSNIQFGNAGIITATTLVGNVTGNINHTSNLLLQIGGSEKFRVGTSGQLGIGGANYGTSGQVLTSGGSGSAATWSTVSGTTINNNADNRFITGSGTANTLEAEANLTSDGTYLNLAHSGTPQILIGSTGGNGATLILDGDGNGDGAGNDYSYISMTTQGVLRIHNFKNEDLEFANGNTVRARFTSSGHFVPQADDTYNLGSTGARWSNLYLNDLQLSNESKKDTGGNDVDGTWGDYTIQEGESDLFLINNRNGKKYQFMLKEIS